ncbi:hypothetical protein FB45DRAFT_878282 [Roridomyces roridus]|uniref:Uncharacterized protein n=1 Tax=Roridomyces roridus TaxID=1738132 RepID=A0AAD7F9A2_9AGAR|nr:hypothetical protein FB45DRAFT_878282 [Roridomyces roridus]
MEAPSDDELQERSDEEDEEAQDPTVTVDNGDEEDVSHQGKCPRNRDRTQYSRQWFPWTDRIASTDMYTGYLDAPPPTDQSMWEMIKGRRGLPFWAISALSRVPHRMGRFHSLRRLQAGIWLEFNLGPSQIH